MAAKNENNEAGAEAAAAQAEPAGGDARPQAADAQTAAPEEAAAPATENENPGETVPAAENAAGDAAAAAPEASGPDWKDRYARLLADFDNFKKRVARDRDDTFRYAEADVIKDVLPTVDNLALALQKAADAEDPFVQGVKLVYDGLLAKLKERGAEPFDSVGEDLDIARMEAIAQLPSPEVPEGKVSVESKRGWMLRGKVLRAAQVVVSAGKPE